MYSSDQVVSTVFKTKWGGHAKQWTQSSFKDKNILNSKNWRWNSHHTFPVSNTIADREAKTLAAVTPADRCQENLGVLFPQTNGGFTEKSKGF